MPLKILLDMKIQAGFFFENHTLRRNTMLKHLKAFLTFAILNLFSTFTLFSQSSDINGTVKDQNGLELAGANVVVLDDANKVVTGASTNPMGIFKIVNVPAGNYKVVARIIGYIEMEKSLTVEAGEDYRLKFILESSEINLNPVVITASKTAEKLSEAPASIQVLQVKDLQNITGTASVADALTGMAGVEMFSQGAVTKSVNTRGYNSIFSGALLVLTDYRNARVPSLNLNALHFLPQQTDDLEQVELVLGPSAALYGPNSHRGVLHLMTKSPFNFQGTTFSITGGERDYNKFEVRHAQTFGDNFAFKISASKLSLHDWEAEDFTSQWSTADSNAQTPDTLKSENYWKTEPLRRNEVLNKYTFEQSQEYKNLKKKIQDEGEGSLNATEQALLFKSKHVGRRNYNVTKQNLDLRFDYKPIEDMTVVFNVAINEMSHLEMTGIGMGITENWQYKFAQLRMNYKDFFFQTFLNKSNSGNTYRADDGNQQIDKSQMFAVQGQYSQILFGMMMTAGFDFQGVTPITEGTINGNYEDIDYYSIVGAYFQAKYAIADNLDFIFAARVDQHSMVDNLALSPKAALIYKMNPENTFRVTLSQAFSTPSSLEYFLDLSRGPMSTFPFNYDVRVQGIPQEKGFSWIKDPVYNRNYFYLANKDADGNPIRYVGSMQDQATWDYLKLIFSLAAGGNVPIYNVPMPSSSEGLEFDLKQLNLTSRTFEKMSDPVDIAPYQNTQYYTFEIGYKGMIENRMMLSADFHYDYQYNLGGPLQMESPFIFINGKTFGEYLLKHRDKIGADSATIMTYANGIAAKAPLGVVSAEGQFRRNSALITYRNIKTGIGLFGAEFTAEYVLTNEIRLMANYSYNAQNKQLNVGGNPNIRLYSATPIHKYNLATSYTNRELGLDMNLRYRYSGEFEVENGSYIGTIEKPYIVNHVKESPNGGVAAQNYVDLDAGVALSENVRMYLQVTNLLNNLQRQFVGAPKIGRFSIFGVKYSM